MKKVITLLLAAGLVIGAASAANAVDTFFRIEYLCFGDFPFVVKEEYSNATSQQEEYFIFFRVQMAVWAEVGSRFKGIEQAVDGIVRMLMKVVVHA